MNRINYFEPYTSKAPHHEDNLTRAFLVVLRYSSQALNYFYQYLYSSFTHSAKCMDLAQDIPELHELDAPDLDFNTQKQTIEELANKLISVLITNERINQTGTIEPVEREARYDGIIRFGNELIVIIENKLNYKDVSRLQLNPSIISMDSEQTEVIKIPVTLEWKKIIKFFLRIRENPISGTIEKLIITDFLDYLNKYFPYLNPYDGFHLCENNESLLYKRIENILLEVASEPVRVKYHTGWSWYIRTDLKEVNQVALTLSYDRSNIENWYLDVFLSFADIIRQAIPFYHNVKDFKQLFKLKEEGWEIKGNFHLSFMNTGLLWFSTPSESLEEYIKFWKENPNMIRQFPKSEIEPLLKELSEMKVILFDEQKQMDYQKRIDDKGYSKINVCPALVVKYKISAKDAIDLDNKGELVWKIKKKMLEGLSIITDTISFIKEIY